MSELTQKMQEAEGRLLLALEKKPLEEGIGKLIYEYLYACARANWIYDIFTKPEDLVNQSTTVVNSLNEHGDSDEMRVSSVRLSGTRVTELAGLELFFIKQSGETEMGFDQQKVQINLLTKLLERCRSEN